MRPEMGGVGSGRLVVALQQPKTPPLYSLASWGGWSLDCSLDEHGLLFAIYGSSVDVTSTTKQSHLVHVPIHLVSCLR